MSLGDTKVDEIADQLGYHRGSVSRWMNDKEQPRRSVILQWAAITGVDARWLETGVAPSVDPRGGLRLVDDDVTEAPVQPTDCTPRRGVLRLVA